MELNGRKLIWKRNCLHFAALGTATRKSDAAMVGEKICVLKLQFLCNWLCLQFCLNRYVNEKERTKELIGNAAVENGVSIIPSKQFPKLTFHRTFSQNNAEKVFKHFPPAMKNRSEEGCFTNLIT